MKPEKHLAPDKQQLLADLKEFQALEKALQEQIRMLEGSLGLPPQLNHKPSVFETRPARPTFHLALGGRLLTRLTDLEAVSGRLVERAEKAGDSKTTLRAIQVSVRILTQVARLAEKHPYLTEGWQPPNRQSPAVAPETPQPPALEKPLNAPATPPQPPEAKERQETATPPVVKKVSEDIKSPGTNAAGQKTVPPPPSGRPAPDKAFPEDLLLAAVYDRWDEKRWEAPIPLA